MLLISYFPILSHLSTPTALVVNAHGEEEEDAWVSIGEDALRELLDRQKTF